MCDFQRNIYSLGLDFFSHITHRQDKGVDPCTFLIYFSFRQLGPKPIFVFFWDTPTVDNKK